MLLIEVDLLYRQFRKYIYGVLKITIVSLIHAILTTCDELFYRNHEKIPSSVLSSLQMNWPLHPFLYMCHDGTTLCTAINDEQGGKVISIDTNEYCTKDIILLKKGSVNKAVMTKDGSCFTIDMKRNCISKYDKSGKLIREAYRRNHWLSDLCISSSPHELIYTGFERMARFSFGGIGVYKIDGNVLTNLLEGPNIKSVSCDHEDNIHAATGKRGISVFSKGGNLLYSYGEQYLSSNNVKRIVFHPDGFVLVNDGNIKVFSPTKQYLYSINTYWCNDFAVDSKGFLWMLCDSQLMKYPPSIIFRLPPPLSLLCESVIIHNMASLPVSTLPPKYANKFKEWSQIVEVEVFPWQIYREPVTLKLKQEMCLGVHTIRYYVRELHPLCSLLDWQTTAQSFYINAKYIGDNRWKCTMDFS